MKFRIISFIILIIYCTMFLSSCSILDPVLYETHLFKRSSEQIYKLAEKSVGEIVTYDKFDQAISLGTCFVYSSDGKLITNYHVIEDAYSASVTIDEKNYMVDKIISYDPDIDLAIIKINATNLTPLSMNYGNVSGGEKVYAVGSSKGLTLSFTTGVVASPDRVFDDVVYIQHDAAISNGNSGGPLFNEYGEVIGINSMGLKEGQNINFAISIEEINNIKYKKSMDFNDFYYENGKEAFKKLRNYAISTGSFDTGTSGSSLYIIQLDSFYTPSVNGTITPCLTYELDSEMIGFYLINDNCTVVIFFDKKLDGTYEVFYKDNNVDALYGTIYASTYVQGTTLDYSYYPGQSTLTKATDMTSLLIYKLDTLYKSIGITAYDLGFKAYK